MGLVGRSDQGGPVSLLLLLSLLFPVQCIDQWVTQGRSNPSLCLSVCLSVCVCVCAGASCCTSTAASAFKGQ